MHIEPDTGPLVGSGSADQCDRTIRAATGPIPWPAFGERGDGNAADLILGAYKALRDCFPYPYGSRCLLKKGLSAASPAPSGRQEGAAIVQNSQLDFLFLLPIGLAVAFLLWVFWNLVKQMHR